MSLEIEKYYATIDSGRLEEAVEMLAEGVQVAMVLPTGVKHDQGRAAMLGYLQARPPVDRKHKVLRLAVDGDLQFAYGLVTENGTLTTGHFVGVMHIDTQGKIDRYQVSFDTEFSLLPADQSTEGA